VRQAQDNVGNVDLAHMTNPRHLDLTVCHTQVRCLDLAMRRAQGSVVLAHMLDPRHLDLAVRQAQVSFIVIDIALAYNVILWRPLLHQIKVIISTRYLTLKFPTQQEVATARGD